ncbi:hypothetical protein ACHQM5_002609 [Ranunculus cassubicifolius]
MAGILHCRRLALHHLTKNNNNTIRSIHRSCVCANQITPPLPVQEQPPILDATAAAATSSSSSSFLRYLKYGVFSTLLGTSAALGYSVYAYTADEIDDMTKAFRHSANTSHNLDDTSSLKKFEASLYSAAVSASSKWIETYLDLRRSIEEQVQGIAEPSSDKLLPDLDPNMQNVLTLVLDLNETLIYTDWKRERGWRTFKRPGADIFLERLGQLYEIVIYSDQLDMYVNPIVDRLDTKHVVIHRLYRPATKYQDGKHYRDLSKLNRDPSRVIYLSGHALETCLQPENCAPVKPWKLEDGDTGLVDLIPFLEFVARKHYNRPNPPDIRQVLTSYKGYDIATEFNNRQREEFYERLW